MGKVEITYYLLKGILVSVDTMYLVVNTNTGSDSSGLNDVVFWIKG
jgi:hypothetical protein